MCDSIFKTAEVQETFINRIDFHIWREVVIDLNDPPRNITVKRIVTGKHPDPVCFNLVSDQVQWLAHLNAERLGFVASRDRASVIVRQHNHRHVLQSWIEDPFGADVEVRAVADRDRTLHARS